MPRRFALSKQQVQLLLKIKLKKEANNFFLSLYFIIVLVPASHRAVAKIPVRTLREKPNDVKQGHRGGGGGGQTGESKTRHRKWGGVKNAKRKKRRSKRRQVFSFCPYSRSLLYISKGNSG